MESAAAAGLRQCLRARTSKSLLRSCRSVSQSSASQYCIAASICPSRNISLSTPSKPLTTRSPSSTNLTSIRTSRLYSSSSSPNTIQGTIGSGAAGISEEAATTKQKIEVPDHLNEKEKEIWELLMKELDCEKLEVQDISGGCGSMYGIEIVSERFRGLGMLKQQRLVNQVLGEEIKSWHGVQLRTRAP